MDAVLYRAAISGETTFLETLTADEEAIYFTQLTPWKNTLLHLAAEFKHVEFFKKVCLKCLPSLISQPNSKDETPLHIAASVGSLEIVEFFIQQLPSDVQGRRQDAIRKKDRDGDTALNCAVKNGEYDIVECLLKTDPELSSFCNYSDESALYLAVSNSYMDIASLIIRLSSPAFSHKGPNGLTALHEAVTNESALKMMEELVERRPEIIKEADDIGWTPFHYTAACDVVDAVKILLKYDISSAAYLLDHDGNSVLHVAAYQGHISVMKELIQSCPDIFELSNKKAQTALHIAVLSNEVRVIKYVLGNSQLAGLLNEPDEDGNTPLHLAVLYYNNYYQDIIEMLAIHTGVDTDIRNKEHKSAYEIYVLNFREDGFKMEKAISLLHGSSTARTIQRLESDVSKEWLNRKPELKPILLGFKEREEESRKSYLKFPEVFLVVATLVTTASFSAALAMPGGYITEGNAKGKPILADKTAFKAFLVFDIVSFFFSLSAVYFQSCAAFTEKIRIRYERFQLWSLGISIVSLALAFASSIYVTQANSNLALAIVPYALVCCLLFIYCICFMLDPFGLGLSFQVYRRIGKYHFQFKCGGPAGRLLPTIRYEIDTGKDGPRGGRERA
ncbi:Nuclear factor NF-kappa-B p105 subunit [Euphorbia peplus]|nr:Nuclear factor NF-kappa-B p105 subunit [Euphorbia peplus]